MKRKIITTADGSHTIRIEEWDEQYHSKHGAIAESNHVFIENGLLQLQHSHIKLLEMGFGTGLNALITLQVAKERDLHIQYTAIETFPIRQEEWSVLNYADALDAPELEKDFHKMHLAAWEEEIPITDFFSLTKMNIDMTSFKAKDEFQLIYFDAFGYRVQPELWTLEIFTNMYRALTAGGILVTYAAKGEVRRTMQRAGFKVERLPGPPGKREMLRGRKIDKTHNLTIA